MRGTGRWLQARRETDVQARASTRHREDHVRPVRAPRVAVAAALEPLNCSTKTRACMKMRSPGELTESNGECVRQDTLKESFVSCFDGTFGVYSGGNGQPNRAPFNSRCLDVACPPSTARYDDHLQRREGEPASSTPFRLAVPSSMRPVSLSKSCRTADLNGKRDAVSVRQTARETTCLSLGSTRVAGTRHGRMVEGRMR